MDFREIEAKSILSPCKIPGIDFVINPYTGCAFGCTYCYASFMGKFLQDKTIQDWGSYVYAKVNAPDLLKKEYPKKIKNKGEGLEVFMSSVTDPYQSVEAKYKLTRQCLEIFNDFGFKGFLSILTKSFLVTRDIDILKKLNNVVVGLTITSTDDSISRYFEKFAPPVSKRFEALEKLNKQGISTYAFIGPLLPHFVSDQDELEKIFEKLVKVGTKKIFIEHLNLSGYIRKRLVTEMKNIEPNIISKFYESQSQDYREELTEVVKGLVKKYDMELLTDTVIFHKEYQKKASKEKTPWKHEYSA